MHDQMSLLLFIRFAYSTMIPIRKKKSIPFLQLKNREGQLRSKVSPRRQYFEDMINTIENKRLLIEGEIIKQKQKTKQISNYYCLRKKIIPSQLRENKIGLRCLESEQKIDRIRGKQKTEKCIENNELRTTIRVKMYTQGIKSAGRRKGDLRELDANRKQKWCLSLSEKQKNSLFYGKQLKIGKKLRQRYLSTEKLKKLRDDMHQRHKNRPICELNSNDKKEGVVNKCPASAKSQKIMTEG